MPENEKKSIDVDSLIKDLESVAGKTLCSEAYWQTKKEKIDDIILKWYKISITPEQCRNTSSLPIEINQQLIQNLRTEFPQIDINEKNFSSFYQVFTKVSLAGLIRKQLAKAQEDPSKEAFTAYISEYLHSTALSLLDNLHILAIMFQTVSSLNLLQIGDFLKYLEKLQDQIAVIKVSTLEKSLKAIKDGRHRSSSLKKKNQSKNAGRAKIYEEVDRFIKGKKDSSDKRILKKELLDQFFKEKHQEIQLYFDTQDQFERAYVHRNVDPNAARSPKLIMPKLPEGAQEKLNIWFNDRKKTQPPHGEQKN